MLSSGLAAGWVPLALAFGFGALGWLAADVASRSRGRSRFNPAETGGPGGNPQWSVGEEIVKDALRNLNDPSVLSRSPLRHLVPSSTGQAAAYELRALLIDVITELAMSRSPRHAEAGRVLLDYYVKGVGSHEVIIERMHLSRPTFYRRLQMGLVLVAREVNQLDSFVMEALPADLVAG